jgi:hypothetical protein
MNYATGCIFEYDANHPEGSGIGFKEEDTPNFTGSFYSKTKAMVTPFEMVTVIYLALLCGDIIFVNSRCN